MVAFPNPNKNPDDDSFAAGEAFVASTYEAVKDWTKEDIQDLAIGLLCIMSFIPGASLVLLVLSSEAEKMVTCPSAAECVRKGLAGIDRYEKDLQKIAVKNPVLKNRWDQA